jgi:nicotinamidase-related amidase
MTNDLDFSKRALILIDVQKEYFGEVLPIGFPPLADSFANLMRAARAAEAAGVEIIAVRHESPMGAPVFQRDSAAWGLHDDIAALPLAAVIDKKLASAFTGTELEDWLRARNIGTATLAGYMTQNCVESTARAAAHLGFAVEVLRDACGALAYENAAGYASAETIHATSCVVMQSNFAAVMATQDWLAVLKGQAVPLRENILVSAARGRARG